MSFTRVAVREAELSHPLASLAAGPGYGSAVVLARWYSEPVALAEVPLAGGRASAEQVARSLWPSVAPLAAARLAAPGRDHPAGHARRRGPAPHFPAELLTRGLRLSWPPAYLLGRATVLHNAPAASVVICTRDRTAEPGRCLTAVLGQDYPDFEVVVVDHAPGSAAADLVARRNAAGTRGVPLRRVVEPRPGLAWARKAGLAATSGTVVAYLDGDACPDRHWLAELARGFTLGRRVAGVSGLVLPTALDTAQGLCDQFGGRSLTPAVFDPAAARPHPRPAFGGGGPVAFARAALAGTGRFDGARNAGTPAVDGAAAGDLRPGDGTFVYWPGAVAWRPAGLPGQPGQSR